MPLGSYFTLCHPSCTHSPSFSALLRDPGGRTQEPSPLASGWLEETGWVVLALSALLSDKATLWLRPPPDPWLLASLQRWLLPTPPPSGLHGGGDGLPCCCSQGASPSLVDSLKSSHFFLNYTLIHFFELTFRGSHLLPAEWWYYSQALVAVSGPTKALDLEVQERVPGHVRGPFIPFWSLLSTPPAMASV